MKSSRFSTAFSAVVLTFCSSPASAWGWQGHQYTGNLAFLLLNPNARYHVRQLLGPEFDLGHAAVWADCARSVEGTPPNLTYAKPPPGAPSHAPKICDDFSDAERQAMIAYAGENWTQCKYQNAYRECHKSFHFADVNVMAHQDYDRQYFGTEDYDVVQAIKAATSVLKCKAGQECPSTAPFNIGSKREALLMLAHFVGDVHQPLHVGAIYLDAANQPGADTDRPTSGGNLLLGTAGDKGSNLHSDWDTVLKSIGVIPSDFAVKAACKIAPLPAPATEPPEKWASETIVAATPAYANMTFSPDTDPHLHGYWDITFSNRSKYLDDMHARQAQQLIVGGARLAALLNSIWPSTKRASKCKV